MTYFIEEWEYWEFKETNGYTFSVTIFPQIDGRKMNRI